MAGKGITLNQDYKILVYIGNFRKISSGLGHSISRYFPNYFDSRHKIAQTLFQLMYLCF